MKKINILRDESAVSPVIATILMVAITVVLAATLYMMLPGGGEAGTPVSGSISAETRTVDGEDRVIINFNSQGAPRRPDWDTLEIYIDGDLVEGYGPENFSFLTGDDEVRSGSSLILTETITYTGAWEWEWEPGPEEVTIFYDDYDGSLKAKF